MDYFKIEQKENYIILTINKPKVNTINFEFVKQIRIHFEKFAFDDKVNGVLLTGLPGVFSAGLDLVELVDYDRETIRSFFTAFSKMHTELIKFPKPLVCAINGHCPAGGTVIALGADHRIMVEGEKYTIGLNEIAVNIQISSNLVHSYSFWLGSNQAYRCILEGKLLNGEEALKVGLIHELVPQEELMDKALTQLTKYLSFDRNIFINTKAKLRKPLIEKLDLNAQNDLDQFENIWWSPKVREEMKRFKEKLQKRSAQKISN